MRGRIRDTFIETHDDIGADPALVIGGRFGGKDMTRSVDMRLKLYAILINTAQGGKAKYLKAARIGEHGAFPADKMMQAARLFNELAAGLEIEMIGIPENDLGA